MDTFSNKNKVIHAVSLFLESYELLTNKRKISFRDRLVLIEKITDILISSGSLSIEIHNTYEKTSVIDLKGNVVYSMTNTHSNREYGFIKSYLTRLRREGGRSDFFIKFQSNYVSKKFNVPRK